MDSKSNQFRLNYVHQNIWSRTLTIINNFSNNGSNLELISNINSFHSTFTPIKRALQKK